MTQPVSAEDSIHYPWGMGSEDQHSALYRGAGLWGLALLAFVFLPLVVILDSVLSLLQK